MYQQLLKQIAQHHIQIIALINQQDNIFVNTVIFGENFHENTESYKEIYFGKLAKKISQLTDLKEKILSHSHKLKDIEIKSLLQEINVKEKKIEFLKKSYDIEAHKINSSHEIENTIPNYDIYNSLFFGTSKQDISIQKNIPIPQLPTYGFSQIELEALMQKSQEFFPILQFNFGEYPGNFYRNSTIHIPKKSEYNIQDIICIFFHETTHFFRDYNGYKNLGFFYRYEGAPSLEEGMAIFNEFYYGNQIVEYGEYYPHYNFCYEILQQDVSLEAKKQAIYEILKLKLFSKEKSETYFHRFYRYSSYDDSNNFFLKDLIYWSGYQRVSNLLRKDPENYEKIMAGKIGSHELEHNILPPKNNVDTRLYFERMMKEISKFLGKQILPE